MIYIIIFVSNLLAIFISVIFTLRILKKRQITTKIDQILNEIESKKEDFLNIVEDEKTEIKDMIIDFDLRLRQAKSTTENLDELIQSNQKHIEKLKEQMEFSEQISQKIHEISSKTETLNQEIGVLDKGLNKVQVIYDLLKDLENKAVEIEKYIHDQKVTISSRLDETLNQIIKEAKEKTKKFVETENILLKELYQKIENVDKNIDEQKYQMETLKEKADYIEQSIDEKYSLESAKIEERFTELIRMYQERFKNMETGLQQIKETAVQSLKDEISRIRSEIDNFNLETIAKRDEIINETRRMANQIVEQIETFQEKYLNVENKLLETINRGKQEIDAKHEELIRQWDYESKTKIEELHLNLNSIKEEIERMRSEKIENLDHVFQNMYGKFQEKFKNFVEGEETKILNVKEDYQNILGKFVDLGEKLKANLLHTMEELKTELSNFARQEKEELLGTREGFLRLRESLESKIDLIEEQIRDISRTKQKIEEIADKTVKEIKEKEDELVHSLEKRASKFIAEQDEKLGKLSHTIDEKISRQLTLLVNKGQLQIEELEKRTSATIQKSMENMQKDLLQVRNEIANMKADIINETEKVRVLKDEVFRELQEDAHRIRKFEEKLSLIDSAEEFILKFDEGLEVLTKRLREIQGNKKELEEFLEKIASVNVVRSKIEQEVKMLTERKALLDSVEERFHSLSEKIQDVEVKLVNMESADKIAERIEQRLLKFEEYRKAFEEFFKELTERRNYIENALRSIERSRKEAIEAGENAKQLIKKLELFEIRKDNVQNELETLEKKVAELKDLDLKFREIEARFQQIDVLMTDLEKKQGQISVMSKRLSEISDKGGFIKSELESLVSEAVEKMDKLSAFYETVERMLQEAEKATKDTKELVEEKRKAHVLDEWKKEGILTLYLKHKWDPELIAERLNIDIALVRAVISSASKT